MSRQLTSANLLLMSPRSKEILISKNLVSAYEAKKAEDAANEMAANNELAAKITLCYQDLLKAANLGKSDL